MKQAILFTIICFLFSCTDQKQGTSEKFQTPFELSGHKETATYLQVIDFYIRLAKEFPEINIKTLGATDSGYPLHLVTFNTDGEFNFRKIGKNKTIILINNGIHPGESDGIDATMLLYRDLATGKCKVPKNTVLATIPVYNVGGALNRNSFSRANQNGPSSYGFRGNAQNYDLNRDFIKADTKNAATFASIFHLVNPDIFIDNHVSNGADYQYTLTHLFTQHNKLGGNLGNYLHQQMMPKLSRLLQKDHWAITPYVNVFNRVPESGFSQFMDSPRYSTGYTTLWNTLGMMVETHMLKPYGQRVKGTYELMVKMMDIAEEDGKKIKTLRQEAFADHLKRTHYPVQWKVDTTRTSTLNFKGFEADTLISKVTGLPRLKYDTNRPFTKKVIYHNYFIPTDTVEIPEAYIIPKGWHKVIDLLKMNKIAYSSMDKDTIILVESYKISDYKTRQAPYEGHYPHHGTKVTKETKRMAFSRGDYLVYTHQPGIRYLLETLEPMASDSFFNWNFFDTILQQKEGFSPYVFEDIALELLNKTPELKKVFEEKKAVDASFSANWYAQLDWLYKRSKYHEAAHLQYPVYRILKSRK